MSNPLENREFKHFLNFKSDTTGMIQISEPVNFDASEFMIEQENYARDISFMNEEISLEFYNGFFEAADSSYQLPNGLIVNKLGHALEFILEYNKNYGFESEIEYILERNNVQFIIGELNFEAAETDNLTYFKCKVVQSTKRALAKRREDVKIDAFSDTDLDNNSISPLETENILLKAKPVTQNSEWSMPEVTVSGGIGGDQAQFRYFHGMNAVVSYGIENSLSYFSEVSDTGESFPCIEAINDLSQLIINAQDINFRLFKLAGLPPHDNVELCYRVGSDFDLSTEVSVQNYGTGTFDGYIYHYTDLSYDISIDNVARGERVWIYFKTIVQPLGLLASILTIYFESGTQTATATSTAIDTVIKGVKYIDLIKQGLKVVNGLELTAPEFETGGVFDNLYAFSGNLIRQRDDVPFYFTLKDRKENLALMNADLQINEDDAFVLQYNKYYDNVDNGSFSIAPDESLTQSYNEKYAINLLEFAFNNYEKENDEEGTIDAVHTKAQFSINNTKVQNTKLIKINDIYDAYKIESLRSGKYKETIALEDDNKILCIDAVPLAPSTLGGFTASMSHNINDGELQLLKDENLPSWELLGFGLGDSFSIVSGQNVGSYTVAELSNTIITLNPVSITPTFTGEVLTEVSYNLTNVSLTNRTNEGFDVIENVDNPDKYSNLRYSIRRNLVNWESYINTGALYIGQDIKNTEFINNGALVTQYQGGETYTENADIDLDTISSAILTPKIYNVRVIVEYDDILTLLQKYQAIATVGGFIRVEDLNGKVLKLYPKKLGYTWATRVLEITGEERFESDVITITKSNDIIYVNEVGYPADELAEVFYQSKGDYMTLLDSNNIKIINYTKYDKFNVSGQTFNNIIELNQAIIDL